MKRFIQLILVIMAVFFFASCSSPRYYTQHNDRRDRHKYNHGRYDRYDRYDRHYHPRPYRTGVGIRIRNW